MTLLHRGINATYTKNDLAAVQLDTARGNAEEQEYVTIKCRVPSSTLEIVFVSAYWLPNNPNNNIQWLKENI